MTRRHYEALARALARVKGDYATRRACAVMVAEVMHEDNPRFDVNRFLAACGLT